MKKLLPLFVAICFLISLVGSASAAWVKPAKSFDSYLPVVEANFLLLTQPSGGGGGYVGPGDITNTYLAWGSCAFVYKASLASTSTNMCDLVAVSGGAAVCTLRGSPTGSVDLTSSYCAGTTPAAACAAAAGGGCVVSQVYDQTGNSVPLLQATLANMPPLAFNAVNGEPCMTTLSNLYSISSSANLGTGPVPFTGSMVGLLDAASQTNGGLVGFGSSQGVLFASTGNWGIYAATTVQPFAAANDVYHAVNTVFNGASSSAYVDGTSIPLGSPGSGVLTGGIWQMFIRSGSHVVGSVCEGGWSSGDQSANYAALNANMQTRYGNQLGKFLGVGDFASGATAFYGLRAYNNAYATGSNPAITVCDTATFSTCSVINILANGSLDTATASGSAACATACVISQFNDQTGNGHTATCASAATCAALTFNCINTNLPCATSGANTSYALGGTAIAVTTGFTLNAVFNRTGGAGFEPVCCTPTTNGIPVFGSTSTVNTGYAGNGGGNQTFTLTNSQHIVTVVYNGASSIASVDTTNNAIPSVGTTGGTISGILRANNLSLTGPIEEFTIWGSTALAPYQTSSVCHNQYLYWKTSTAC